MGRRGESVSTAAATLFAAVMATSASSLDPFTFLAPDVTVGSAERARLEADEAVVSVLSGRDGFLSVSAVIRVRLTSDRLATWARSVEAMHKGRYVPEIGRFSTPPRLEDLQALTLEQDDLEDLRRCKPGACGVKLANVEIAQVRAAIDDADLAVAFRRVLVHRAADYLSRGDECALPYHDHKTAVRPGDAFAAVVRRFEFFPNNLPCYADYLREFPRWHDHHVRESFLYWSKETLGTRPIISITHVSMAQFDAPGMPEVMVVAKQVYATHYKNASLAVTALTHDGISKYLVYVNRSHIDAFNGVFGGVVRRIVERRIKAESPGLLRGLRTRLEEGNPP